RGHPLAPAAAVPRAPRLGPRRVRRVRAGPRVAALRRHPHSTGVAPAAAVSAWHGRNAHALSAFPATTSGAGVQRRDRPAEHGRRPARPTGRSADRARTGDRSDHHARTAVVDSRPHPGRAGRLPQPGSRPPARPREGGRDHRCRSPPTLTYPFPHPRSMLEESTMTQIAAEAPPSATPQGLARGKLNAPMISFFMIASLGPLLVCAGTLPSSIAATGLTTFPVAYMLTAAVLAIFAPGY